VFLARTSEVPSPDRAKAVLGRRRIFFASSTFPAAIGRTVSGHASIDGEAAAMVPPEKRRAGAFSFGGGRALIDCGPRERPDVPRSFLACPVCGRDPSATPGRPLRSRTGTAYGVLHRASGFGAMDGIRLFRGALGGTVYVLPRFTYRSEQ